MSTDSTSVIYNTSPQETVQGSFNVRVSPEIHRSLALYSSSRGKTLNATVEEAIKQLVMSQ
ncbi:MAG: toxin-antitoxin system HicB family antitoxin [Treponema sp.]|nr:toxin-antitoxin system HicB family antitoxin [Treponema sp.]